MADESPVIRQKLSQQSLKHLNSNPLSIVDHSHPSDNNGMLSDEELSVGGTTPPPARSHDHHRRARGDDSSLSAESDAFEEEREIDGDKDSVGSTTLIKFSIDNILKKNSEFGRMNAAESAVAAVASLHHHHKQLIQHQPATEASPTDSSFLGAFHQLPFLAAARQMILAATTGGTQSQIDYHNQHHLAAHLAQYPVVHPLSSLMLTQNQHQQPNSLNLVQSCTDKFLGSNNFKGSNWAPHQPAPPSGSSKSAYQALASVHSSGSSNSKPKVQQQQVNNKSQHHQANSKAIDLTVRNSVSPPLDHRGRTISAIADDKKLSVSQLSPMLASSTDENASASPTRSVSVISIVDLFC